MEIRGYCCSVPDFLIIKPILSHQKQLSMTFRKKLWYFLYCWRPSWSFNNNYNIVDQVSKKQIPQNKKVILNTKVKFCVSAVPPVMMYNHDNNCDFICYFVVHFVFSNLKGKPKSRAWHGAYLESAYPNCVKTTAWQIVLKNALQSLRMRIF